MVSLGRWAARSPTPPSAAPIASPDSIVLALRARFDATAAQRSGGLTIEGDKAAVERFVRLFPMPEPAVA